MHDDSTTVPTSCHGQQRYNAGSPSDMVRFESNSAVFGGACFGSGVINEAQAIANAVFVGNSAANGGAVAASLTSATFTNVVAEGNSAQTGGAFSVSVTPAYTCQASFVDSVLNGNRAENGGAMR